MNDRGGAFFSHPVCSDEIIARIQKTCGAQLQVTGADKLSLEGVCDSRVGGRNQLVFAYAEQLTEEQGLIESLVLIDAEPRNHLVGNNQYCIVADPRAAFIDTISWMIAEIGIEPHYPDFGQTAKISPNAMISESAIIEAGVNIGEGSIVAAGAVIKAGTRIGRHSVIKENAVIGSDGITVYRASDGRLLKFPHVGGVSIGNYTEVGANCVVATGILAPTSIGDEVVVGNLCNIGHGAVVGDGVWMSVGSLVGGHAVVDRKATLAMGVSVRDNICIGESASIGMGSVVVKSVAASHSMYGNPAKRLPGLKTGPKR